MNTLHSTVSPNEFLLMLTVKSSLIVLVSYASAKLLARLSASSRHLIWSSTIVALLLLPIAMLVSPAIPLPMLASAVVDDSFAASETAMRPLSDKGREGYLTSPPAGLLPPDVTVERSGRPRADIGSYLLILYFVGALSSLAYFILGLARVSRLSESSVPVPNKRAWQTLLDQHCSSTKRGSQARLIFTRMIRSPMTWGCLRPVILLPTDTQEWSRRECRNILLHELAHVRRNDWATLMLARAVCTMYWFQPLVWLAVRRLKLEAEHACDDLVLASGTAPSDYAEQLLKITQNFREAKSPILAAVTFAPQHQLISRINAVLNSKLRRIPMNRLTALALALSLSICAVFIASLQPVAAGPPSDSVSSTSDVGLRLNRAAAAGDLQAVKLLVSQGADVNAAFRSVSDTADLQRTPLTNAARSGHLEVVGYLLDIGAEIDAAPRGDATALIEASREGHAEVALLLVDRGASVNRVVKGDGSPLIGAVASGDIETVRMLLKHGADPNEWVEEDEGPLFHAVRNGDAKVAELLVAAGADISSKYRGDGTPLMIAAGQNNTELVRQLISEGADVDAEVKGDGSALIVASRRGNLEAVRLLVESGADVDQVVPGDENPLIQASIGGSVEVVRLLLEAGADPNAKVFANDQEVRTALSEARRRGHSEISTLLTDFGAKE